MLSGMRLGRIGMIVPFLLVTYLSNSNRCFSQEATASDEAIAQRDSPILESSDLVRVGAWPFGPALAVAVDQERQLIYLGSGGGVLILDGSDLANPSLVSDKIVTGGLVEDLAYDPDNQLLLVAAGEGGFEIWDVQTPSQPDQLSSMEVLYYGAETPVESVGLYGDFAIVECSWGYVHSINISDPTNPFQVGFNGLMGNPARDINVSADGNVHAVGYSSYVRLFVQPDGILTDSGGRDYFSPSIIFGTEEVAYAGYSGYLYILDLLDPYFSTLSSTYLGSISDIVAEGNRAYILNSSGLQVFDVSSYTNPIQIGSLEMTIGGNRFAVADGYAYVANGIYGLSIIELGDGTTPVEVGSYGVMSLTWDAYVVGNYAYLAHELDGLVILDVTDRSNPELIGQYDTPGEARDVTVAGGYAYIADYEGGLRIADVTDPANPTEVGVFDPVNVWRVAVSGDYAYEIDLIPNELNWLRVLDVSDPANPTELGSLSFPDFVWQIAVSGNYVYIANNDRGMRVVDVSDPDHPVEVSSFNALSVIDVFLKDDYAYLASADWAGGFLIVDISNPAAPTLVSRYNPDGWFHPFHVYGEGDYAYVGEPTGIPEIRFMDVSDLGNPVELGSIVPADDLFKLYASGQYLYIANGNAGLQIFENLLMGSTGVTCGDVTSFVARCIGGGTKTIQARLRANGDWTGTDITIDIDGTSYIVPAQVKADGSASQWKLQAAGASAGTHTVTLIDPAGCYSPLIVDCSLNQAIGEEWDDDASWNETDLDATGIPSTTRLVGNYPNPFNPVTTISYELPVSSHVTLIVSDIVGREVARLVDGVQEAGYMSVTFDARNLASGIYFYRLQTRGFVETKKMMLLR